MKTPMKILIFSPPFNGHLNVLEFLKISLGNLGHNVKLVITGWSDIPVKLSTIADDNPDVIQLANSTSISSVNTNADADADADVNGIGDNTVNSSCPMTFTLSRVCNLTDKCIEICSDFNPNLIIYDFFSLEGFICGKNLSIPAFCSIPAMIGPYNRNNKFFISKLHNPINQTFIREIHTKYGINLMAENIQQISDGILVPSDVNILWSYPNIVDCDDYLRYRNLKKNNFLTIGPRKTMGSESNPHTKKILDRYHAKLASISPEPAPINAINITKKSPAHNTNGNSGGRNTSAIALNSNNNNNNRTSTHATVQQMYSIYISLGTVVTQNLWNHNPHVRLFVLELFVHLIKIFDDKDQFTVVVAIGNNPELEASFKWPSNFHVYNTVDQLKVLANSHLFITHCGGNSFNEAIANQVPMIGIPFFGDQHIIGHKINKLNLGIAFLHRDPDEFVGTENNPFHRSSLSPTKLELAVNHILSNHPDFLHRIRKIKDSPIPPIDSVIMIYYNYPLVWKNGDLLYGTNTDRLSLVKYLKIENDFRICKYLPFSKLFSDKRGDASLLPRIVDIYNDGFLDPNCYPVESSSYFTQYSTNLQTDYKTWLLDHKEFIAPVTDLLDITDSNRDEVIWNICLGGIEFFTQVKGYNIHFVLEKYSKVNKATTLELQHIMKHWDRLKSKISFYHLDTKYGILSQMSHYHT